MDCLECNEVITSKSATKYCSSSCSARASNRSRPSRVTGKCARCEKPISSSRKYCSRECQYPKTSNKVETCTECNEPRASGSRCRRHYNEYMRVYMTERYHKRRTAFIESRGGVCVDCGSSDRLEIDHIDPKDKLFDVGKALSGWSDDKLGPELAKCQLLCYDCHLEKSRSDRSEMFGQRVYWEHGTLGGYRYCKCILCGEAKRQYNKEYKEKLRTRS